MLRALVAVLLVANLAWFAWAMGWLQPLGLGPPARGEPERLARQVRPESLRVAPESLASEAPAASAASAPTAPTASAEAAAAPAPEPTASSVAQAASAPASGVCLQAGVFDEQQVAAVRSAAARLPTGSWQLVSATVPGRWMIYMGRYPDAATAAAKRAEVRNLGVDTDRPGAALEPGISLGRFSSEEAADRGLEIVSKKGVRTARVVQERRDAPGYVLRLPAVDAALRPQLRALAPQLGGREWRACD